MSDMRNLLDIINEMSEEGSMELEDSFDFELNEETLIESGIVGFTDDGIIVECDETALQLLESNGLQLEEVEVDESGLQAYLGKKKYGKEGMSALQKAGREVPLGKPMKGDVKKSKVYVKGPKGNVVKVNFGDKKMRIKKSNPGRRKNFRARHNCDNPGPRWKARYWSCRAW